MAKPKPTTAKKILLWGAGILLVLIGIALSIPGVPIPGLPFIYWGLTILGFQSTFIAVIIWCFTVVGLGGMGATLVKWLKKIGPKDSDTEGNPPS
jgi:hypothetical protein